MRVCIQTVLALFLIIIFFYMAAFPLSRSSSSSSSSGASSKKTKQKRKRGVVDEASALSPASVLGLIVAGIAEVCDRGQTTLIPSYVSW